MKSTLHLSKNLIIFGLPLGLFGLLICLMKLPIFIEKGVLSKAVTVDLLLFIPLVYFLLIRKTAIPKTTVIPMMGLGLLIGSYFLPKENQGYVSLFKTWALPIIEFLVLGFVVIKAKRGLKIYQGLKGSSRDFYDALKKYMFRNSSPKTGIAFCHRSCGILLWFCQLASKAA